MNRKTLAYLLLFSISFSAFSQQNIGQTKLNDLNNNFNSDIDLAHGVYAFQLLNAKTGKVVTEHNPNLSLVPASTLKVLTTGAAVGILGANFRYETTLAYTGTLDSINGVLNGNLMVIGSGDPTLNSQYFRKKNDSTTTASEWASLIKKKGIKKITGSLIVDVSCFDDAVPSTWIWGDMGNYFGAGATGLSWNDNKYYLYFNSGNIGEAAVLTKVYPTVKNLTFENKVTAGGAGDYAFIYGAPETYHRIVKGTIPANQNNYEVEGSLPDPPFSFAESFIGEIKKLNILFAGEIIINKEVSKKNTNYKTIQVHKSPSLEKIIYHTNLRSNNHYAESLLKTIAWKKTGKGSTNMGTELVKAFWKSRGVEVQGLFLDDGSGLSRSNGITAAQLANVMAKIYRDSLLYKVINPSLPVAGVNGSLASLGKGSFIENNLRAKSGYITRARSYAGFVKSKSGEEYCFSVIFNNYTCSPTEVKKKMEKLMELFPEL